jgi:hypothetical protein
MSLKWEHVQELDEQGEIGFEGDIGTLYCDVTGKALAQLLIQQQTDEVRQVVKATSPFAPGASSGEHMVEGVLSYGPIVSNASPTIVENIDVDEVADGDFEGEQLLTLEVIKG